MKRPTKPVIGISSSVEYHNEIQSVLVHEKYTRSVIDAGGIPIVLPLATDGMAEQLVSICHGLILTGGEDIDPYYYKAAPHPKLQKTNGKRDKLEIELVQYARKQNKPILAICRGVTIANVALGGTVIQDIEASLPNAINHSQKAARSEPTHDIHLDQTSRLFQIFDSQKIRVNSMHHQAIDELAPCLRKVATAPDGVIEAVEGKTPLLLGVQWHPEEMANDNRSMSLLFEEFIAECLHNVQVEREY
ncbi:gamma-glutamyl-gamma-aminobutyrate hydrolase family protein [Halalkalibacter kiskunsagensis]|uniref:Gamma-glutamyl-gamma-aminobutyrate hydrolase family protein n=1 Tax=Halalkalibacter kiskunsagensis TaxID=1548599 RepID=A0ABV6KCW0_9BACI